VKLRFRTGIFTVATTLLLLSCAAEAAGATLNNDDHITLKNGDRISGLVVKMQNKKLEVDPDYSAVNIIIDWEDVRSITTTRMMSIKLYGDVEMPDNIGVRIDDRILLHSLEEGGPIRLLDVRSINLAEQDYYGYLSAGGNQTSGNTETLALNLSGSLTYRKYEHRFILDGKYNRAQTDGEDTANNGAFTIKYDKYGLFASPRLFTGGFSLVEGDQFQNLAIRNTTGIVLGYDLLDGAQQVLTVAVGPAAVYQDFTTTPSTITPSATWLAAYELRLRGNDVILWHKQQGFQDAGHGSATRFNADQGIRIKIIGELRLNFEYDFRYNSRPVENKKTIDTNLVFGLSYDIKP
jgi:putative salt-induced outer membrane protein YdiY